MRALPIGFIGIMILVATLPSLAVEAKPSGVVVSVDRAGAGWVSFRLTTTSSANITLGLPWKGDGAMGIYLYDANLSVRATDVETFTDRDNYDAHIGPVEFHHEISYGDPNLTNFYTAGFLGDNRTYTFYAVVWVAGYHGNWSVIVATADGAVPVNILQGQDAFYLNVEDFLAPAALRVSSTQAGVVAQVGLFATKTLDVQHHFVGYFGAQDPLALTGVTDVRMKMSWPNGKTVACPCTSFPVVGSDATAGPYTFSLTGATAGPFLGPLLAGADAEIDTG